MLRERFTAALKEAMLKQEKRRIATLRLVQAAVKDRDIAARTAGKDGAVSDDEILELLGKMIKQRLESARQYEEGKRPELASQEREEIEIIKEFLPQQLDEAELRAAVAEAIKATGAESVKDMGKCMAELKARYAGRMDFAKARQVVKELLQQS
jgi:uncharacterized protein YqeY